jgi:hypothetical protein
MTESAFGGNLQSEVRRSVIIIIIININIVIMIIIIVVVVSTCSCLTFRSYRDLVRLD